MVAEQREIKGIEEGCTAQLVKKITAEDISAFADVSGDYNPLHLDAEYAKNTSFKKPVAHGMLLASLVSRLVGMQLPGAGALWTRQSFRWLLPVFAGDTIELTLRVTHISVGSSTITIEVNAVNQDGRLVMNGDGAVMLVEKREPKQGKSLGERVAFVSSALGDVGGAIASQLASAGASVAVSYADETSSANDIVASIVDQGGRAISVHANLTDPGSVSTAFGFLEREFGRPVDLLINNAAISFTPKPFSELGWQEVQELLEVSVRSAFCCSQRALPAMIEQKSGCIVNIGSVLTRQVPPPQWSAFVLAKSALAGLTRSLAAEFGPHGVRINMVSPGTTEADTTGGLPERLRKVQAMQTPLRRLVEPIDIAKTVVFLCSDAAEFITGADVPVCGGTSM
jgi:3-oxoacyl-[acyl-carrier protein] reductase